MRNKLLNNKLIAVILVSILIISTVPVGIFASRLDTAQAVTVSELESQQRKIISELNELSSKQEAKQEEIDEIQSKIDKKTKQLNKAKADLEEAEDKIDSRKDALNSRVRAMYKNGSVGYLDIILGSGDLSELLSNIDMVQRIYKSDQQTLTELEEHRKEIEEKKTKLQDEKKELDEEKSKLKDAKAEMDKTEASLKSKYNKLKAQERQLLASAAGNSGNSGSYGNGRFMWPTVSHRYITAEYGQIRPYERHPGMDIAGIGYGSRIMASASGKVVLSGWYGGYGYCVIVDHGSIGGGKHLYSLYGHNSSLAVSVGQNVSKGQTIAYAGSTGWSTGTHCHWEVRIGRSINSYYTVNPRNYL